MLANLLTLLHPLLVLMCLPYPDYAPKSVLSFKKLLEVVHPSFPLPISGMPFVLSPLERQRMLFR
ncbi:hypothetical protein HD554DRAFT_2079511 [Boletus coccyginus]|nr:hypothetical protein HD554DRAFT_2079511 [Boletus coccyginus]